MSDSRQLRSTHPGTWVVIVIFSLFAGSQLNASASFAAQSPATCEVASRDNLCVDDASANELHPVDWKLEPSSKVELRIRSDHNTTVELRLHRRDVPMQFRWRRIDVLAGQWQTFRLPLATFRDGVRLIRPEEIGGWSIVSQVTASVETDAVRIVSGKTDPDAILKLAFGDEYRSITGKWCRVATDDPTLDLAAALEQLEEVGRLTSELFPKLPAPSSPAVVLVFRERAAYEAFWPRLARTFEATIDPVDSDGFCLRNVAGFPRGEGPDLLRPVATHEAFHALFAEQSRFNATGGHWLHEALATYVQQTLAGHDTLAAPPRRPIHLVRLLGGQIKLERRDYGRAAHAMAWLLADDERRAALEKAMRVMADEASLDMLPHIPACFGVTPAELMRQYNAFCRESD